MTKFLNISTDNTLGGSSASDVLVASQKAVKDYVDQHGGGGGSVAIDDTTITRNTDNEIQAVATINANAATGATNPIYDWVGTEAEYVAQDIETNHPDWVCFITDDCANTESLIVRREVAERNIGELVYTTIPVSDAGLHLADGELLNGTGIYADFYNYMVSVYNAGHTSIFCSEADWQAEIADHNMCGKYVLDTTNHTIRLPSIWGWVEGIRTESSVGTYVPPGLPNITAGGIMGWKSDSAEFTSGAYHKEYNNGAYSLTTNTNFIRTGPGTIDASLCSSVYGTQTQDAVQPRGVQVLVYIVIANTVKTPIQVDIDEVATDLNHKVNKGHEVIDFQEPTADNNYTWYRKYADGWVEQGGVLPSISTSSDITVSLPITMSSTEYSWNVGYSYNNTGSMDWKAISIWGQTTTSFNIRNSAGIKKSWEVKGMAAS